jgi:hypothetical protein
MFFSLSRRWLISDSAAPGPSKRKIPRKKTKEGKEGKESELSLGTRCCHCNPLSARLLISAAKVPVLRPEEEKKKISRKEKKDEAKKEKKKGNKKEEKKEQKKKQNRGTKRVRLTCMEGTITVALNNNGAVNTTSRKDSAGRSLRPSIVP